MNAYRVPCLQRESARSPRYLHTLAAWARRCRQVLCGALLAGIASAAAASPIQYTITGTGTGSLGTLGFVNSTVTITGVSDASNVVAVSGTVYCNHLTSVTFSVGGVGSGAIVESMNIFDNTTNSVMGFQFGTGCPGGQDWLDSTRPAFGTWHLDTEIGPVALEPALGATSALHTTRGLLTLIGLSGATFRATAGVAAPEARAGLFDPTFANAGKAVYPAPATQNNYAYVQSIVVQPDASIAFVGYTNSESTMVRRLTASGLIDATFGTGGAAAANVSDAFALALQADGKFVVAGTGSDGFALTRLFPSGAQDLSFGVGGTASTRFGLLGALPFKLLVQPDGKLVAIGMTSYGSSSTLNTIALARYLPDGVADDAFGGHGTQIRVEPDGSTFGYIDAALQPDGKIVVGAFRLSPVGPILQRFTAGGQIDGTFATGAPAAKGFTAVTSVLAQPDGKVIVMGLSDTANLVLRLNGDGSPDPTYGVGGLVTLSVPGTTLRIDASTLQPDGKVVLLLGDWSGSPAPVSRLARLTTTGALDATFGTGGLARIDSADPFYPGRTLALQADGKIVLGGELDTGTGAARLAHQAIMRFQGDPITGTIVEFFNSLLSHFFITASAVEQASIDAGGSGPGWSRTGLTFKSGGVSRACRFYGTPGVGPNSHFYTLEPAECAQVRMDPGWHFESYDFSATPAGADGGCGSGTVPIFRAYNHRFAQNDSNHRYTATPSVYNTQVDSTGWSPEGVVFCVPQ